MSLAHTFVQAAKILANLIVMGSSIVARALVQAYRQALQSKFSLVMVTQCVACNSSIVFFFFAILCS